MFFLTAVFVYIDSSYCLFACVLFLYISCMFVWLRILFVLSESNWLDKVTNVNSTLTNALLHLIAPFSPHQIHPSNPTLSLVKQKNLFDPSFSVTSTFELSGLEQFLPLGADLLHATSHLSGGIMFSVQQLLPRLLQGINAALIGWQLCFKSLVFLYLALQVGGVLLSREKISQRLENGMIDAASITLECINRCQNGGCILQQNLQLFDELPCKPHLWQSSSSRWSNSWAHLSLWRTAAGGKSPPRQHDETEHAHAGRCGG